MKKLDLERNELIFNLYFEDKLNLTEISKKVNLSVSQISRILSTHPKYEQEKATRKLENQRKHIEQTKQLIKNNRQKKHVTDKAIMDTLHNQAVMELSYSSHISKIAIRKSCSSVYKYNIHKKRFELKENVCCSSDMPRIIRY